MSFISISRKHGISAYDTLTAAFAGNAEISFSKEGGSEQLQIKKEYGCTQCRNAVSVNAAEDLLSKQKKETQP